MHTYKLPRHIVNGMLTLAQSKTDQEICGLISQDKNQKMTLIPIPNIAKEPEKFFEMDPTSTIKAMKNIRENDSDLFAIFHSHPHTPAYPSKTDIELSGYPQALYLIISLNTKGVLELKGFKIQDDSVVNADLVL